MLSAPEHLQIPLKAVGKILAQLKLMGVLLLTLMRPEFHPTAAAGTQLVPAPWPIEDGYRRAIAVLMHIALESTGHTLIFLISDLGCLGGPADL